ncbi:hypothetical protein BHE74_00028853 [Ensete ventricosum]|nr:hypothetical protein BHE74_00028853 [Ensete ventricosum]
MVKIGGVGEESEGQKEFLPGSVTSSHPTQMHYFGIGKKEEVKEPFDSDAEESELVSLSLGTRESRLRREEKAKNTSSDRCRRDELEEGLSLGLECKMEAPASRQLGKPLPDLDADHDSFEEPKNEGSGEPWPLSRRTQISRNEDEGVSPQHTLKRARVSVRARCDAPTMSDGCHWRKYGQKVAKGNPCPRAYYRCTVAPGCPVRKQLFLSFPFLSQVQRCAEDLSILITTYEGTHNHPLPVSATAMASTTSAAASMLMSGSTSSTSIASGIHGASIGTSNNSMPWHFSSPSPSFYSATSHPTVTLDLTAPSSTPQLRFPSNFSSISGYSSGLSFSTTESSTLPIPWSNIYPNYGVQPYTKSSTASLFLGRQPQDTFNLSYLPKTSSSAPSLPSQRSLTDMIAGAITSHPSFQSALTAAVTSYIGGARGAQAGKEILSPKISHNIPPLPPHHGWRTNLTSGIRLLLLPPRSLHRRPPLGPHRRRDLRALASDHRSHLRRRRHPSHPHPPRCRPGRGDPHLPLFPRGTYRTGRHGQVQGAAYPDLAGLGAATRRRRSASGAHPLASGHPRGARQRGEGVRQVEHDLPAVGEGKGRFALMSDSVSHWSRTIMWIPEPERGRSRKQVLTWSIGRAQCLMRKASFNIRTGAGCSRMLRCFVRS